MTDSTISVVINAPVEQVWSLLIEHQQSNRQEMFEQKYSWREPEGPPVAGQVIHWKVWFLHMTISIERVVQADPPMVGQTIYTRLSFFGKSGEGVNSWVGDSERYHLQNQSELKHPWCEATDNTSIYCVDMDDISCVVVYVNQSEMTLRLLPRWLTQRFNTDETTEKITAKAVEASLQKIKAEAEKNMNGRKV
ncbi:MAG: hypothetical protein H0W02_07490 [Ktedonobacteraceae bacterium]|nr:hypothetical protein [Ktedonobacteraceae bacterium]